MRDTIIALLMMAGIAGGYYVMRKTDSVIPHAEIPKAAPAKHAQSHSSTMLAANNHTKGAKHGEKPNRIHSQQIKGHREDQGASVDVAEASDLPSIYEEREESRAADAGVKSRKKSKYLHGVAVQAYLDSKKDRVSLAAVPDDAPSGIRVFLQCMELKKHGPDPLAERDCHALAFRGIPRDRGGAAIDD